MRYISTGLDDTPANRREVDARCWAIEEDLRLGMFDTTLERYRKPTPQVRRTPPLNELWQQYIEFKRPSLAPTTYEKLHKTWFTNHINSFPTQELSRAVSIRDHLLKNTSPATTKRLLYELSACCYWAVKSGIILTNPFAGMANEVKTPAGSSSAIDPFSTSEREAILGAFKAHPRHQHYYNFVVFLFLTGCRTGEARALQWRHITKDNRHITFCESYDAGLRLRKGTKTGAVRRFPCNAPLQELLHQHRSAATSSDELVFSTVTGKVIGNDFLKLVWRDVVLRLVEEGAVRRYRPQYNTRHTFITDALESGLDAKDVAYLVGNTPKVIYEHYAGCRVEKLVVPVF